MPIADLFQNKLFLQYLAGAGQDIGSGNAIGTNVNKITQQNIASQNQAKLLQKLLGQGVDFKSGEDGGISMKFNDAETMTKLLGGEDGTAKSPLTTPSLDSSNLNNLESFGSGLNIGGQTKSVSDALNPSASPLGNLSPSDLAGLTPQDLSNALGIKLAFDQAEQKKVSDQQNFGLQQSKLLAAMNKDERTAAIQNYEYAVQQGYKGKFDEFQKDARTSHIKDYQYAVKEGYKGDFNSWLRDMTALGGGLTLGEKVAEKKEFSKLKGQFYFDDPKWTTELDKYMSSEDVQNKLFISDNPSYDRQVEAIRFIEGKITGGGGEIQDVRKSDDGESIIWKVKWPSGDVKEIKRGISS